jgi:hypothetical protein
MDETCKGFNEGGAVDDGGLLEGDESVDEEGTGEAGDLADDMESESIDDLFNELDRLEAEDVLPATITASTSSSSNNSSNNSVSNSSSSSSSSVNSNRSGGTAGPLTGTTIIYLPTRKEVERMAKVLCGAGLAAAPYHAGLPAKSLLTVHRDFLSGKVTVVTATVAFGMGINKVCTISTFSRCLAQSNTYDHIRARANNRPTFAALYITVRTRTGNHLVLVTLQQHGACIGRMAAVAGAAAPGGRARGP